MMRGACADENTMCTYMHTHPHTHTHAKTVFLTTITQHECDEHNFIPRLINTEHDNEKCADRFMCLF